MFLKMLYYQFFASLRFISIRLLPYLCPFMMLRQVQLDVIHLRFSNAPYVKLLGASPATILNKYHCVIPVGEKF